jgi:hypothetical protein
VNVADPPAEPMHRPWSTLGPRVFATPPDEPRARRASDVLKLVTSAIALLMLVVITAPEPGFIDALTRFLLSFPSFLDGLWQFTLDLLVVYALGLVVVASARRRWSLTRDLVLVIFVAAGLTMLVGRWVEGSWPAAWDALGAASPPSHFPAACGSV